MMEEPLSHLLASLSKKYLGELNKSLSGLSIDRYHYVLVLIDTHNESLSQKALAELLHIDKSYMVIILDYLAKKGYILRERNPEDRREQFIRLTGKARGDLPVIRAAIDDLNTRSMQNISPGEKRSFNHLLHVIQSNLSDISRNEQPVIKNYS